MEQRVLSSENIVEGASVIAFQNIQRVLKDRNVINLALSGGKSPAEFYRKLASKINLLDEFELNVFQVDERYVDQASDDSNQKMIMENFIEHLDPKGEVNYYFYNTDLPIGDAVNLYDELLKEKSIDMAIMGVGTDGHTASIFPDSTYTRIRYDKEVIYTNEYKGYRRLTMTHRSLLECSQLLFYVPGVYKRKVLEKIVDERNINFLPASFILHRHQNCILIREK